MQLYSYLSNLWLLRETLEASSWKCLSCMWFAVACLVCMSATCLAVECWHRKFKNPLCSNNSFCASVHLEQACVYMCMCVCVCACVRACVPVCLTVAPHQPLCDLISKYPHNTHVFPMSPKRLGYANLADWLNATPFTLSYVHNTPFHAQWVYTEWVFVLVYSSHHHTG